jgi:hypothetical protein
VTPNPYDQAARYAAHLLDEDGFLAWLLPRVVSRYNFHPWLNTRNRIKTGELSRCVLPWIVLMQGGGEVSIIEQWKPVASGEPDGRKCADYGGLALVFADLAGCHQVWETALEGWNMVESEVVKKWQEKARIEGRAEGEATAMRTGLRKVLQSRSQQPLPQEILDKVAAVDLDTLRPWFDIALSVGSLDEFLTQVNGA